MSRSLLLGGFALLAGLSLVALWRAVGEVDAAEPPAAPRALAETPQAGEPLPELVDPGASGSTAAVTGNMRSATPRREAVLGAIQDCAMLAHQLLSGEEGCEAMRAELRAVLETTRRLLDAEFPGRWGTEPGA